MDTMTKVLVMWCVFDYDHWVLSDHSCMTDLGTILDQWPYSMPLVIGRASLRSASSCDNTMKNFSLNFLEALNDVNIAKKLCDVLFGGFKEMCQTMEQNIVSSLRAEIKKHDDQIVTLKAEITALKTKTDDMEQWTRRGSMRIQGIPESTPGSLDDKLLFLFNTRLKIQPPIAKEEVKVAHRLPRGGAVPPQDGAAADGNYPEDATQPPTTIIVKFVSRRTKEIVMGKKSDLKKNQTNWWTFYLFSRWSDCYPGQTFFQC